VLVLIILTPDASADTKTYQDANDTAGGLDIRSVSQGHRGSDLEHRIITFERWTLDGLDGGFGMTINVTSNDPTGDNYGFFADYCVEIHPGRRGLRGQMSRCMSASGVVGSVEALHPKPKLLIIRFPDAYMSEPGPYEWNASASFRGSSGCRNKYCHDLAPGAENVIDFPGYHER
jgi:hypothetical protein